MALFAALAPCACATQPESGGGNKNLPNAATGPFRAITTPELGNLRSAPNALEDKRGFARDPSVIHRDGKQATLAVIGYFGAALKQGDQNPSPADPTRAIVRYAAEDGRSFDRSGDVVLTAEEPWEGGLIGAPMALFVGDEVFLYYAAEGGIGLARSQDTSHFTRVPGPVLEPAAAGWEGGSAPRSPGVVRLEDGSFHMFYEVARSDGTTAIGEARSSDGITFTRVGEGPAFAPAGSAEAGGEAPYDAASVGAPFPLLVTSAEGRLIERLYYAARDAAGNRVIGLAARFGGEGAFERAVAPVFGTSGSLAPGEPCALPFDDFTLLFVTQRASRTSDAPAVAVGVAPGTAVLPPPNPP